MKKAIADRRGISRIKGELEFLAREEAGVRQDLDDLQTERTGIVRELDSLKEGGEGG